MSLPVFLTDGQGNRIETVNGSIPVISDGGIVPGTVVTETAIDGGTIDAFGRNRVSQPTTLFDSKLVNDAHGLDWDDQETSGSGTSSTYNINRSDMRIETTTGTAGTRVRQSFRHMNYYAAKSHLIFMTFARMQTSTGMTKRAGYFEDRDGLFFQSQNGVQSFVIRSSTSGTPVDTVIPQSTWNIDKLDGTGPSGITLNPQYGNILVIDFEWLGVGRIRFGFVINGALVYCHGVNYANTADVVYMRSPTLPIRYEISNDGTGTSDLFMYCICASVSTEGEQDKVGYPRTSGMEDSVTLDAQGAFTWAVFGMRLKSDHLNASVRLSTLQAFGETNDGILVTVHATPTINGSANWTAVDNSALETFVGDGQTLDITSPGVLVYQFAVYGRNDLAQISDADFPILGSKIDGTPTTLVIGCKALTTGAKVLVSANWREL